MATIKNVGLHAQDLADGRMLAPGETLEVDSDALNDPLTQDLLNVGTLLEIKAEKGSAKSGSGREE